MKTEHRILRVLKDRRVIVIEVWDTGHQVVTYPNVAALTAKVEAETRNTPRSKIIQ